ncbi:hypothetical protein D3C76_1660940 [compost metagenome]
MRLCRFQQVGEGMGAQTLVDDHSNAAGPGFALAFAGGIHQLLLPERLRCDFH